MIVHPTLKTLCRYADNGLAERRRVRVAAHLADCPHCRNTIASLRNIDEVARGIPVPEPSPDVLERILARRGAGARVILPVAAPERRVPSRKRLSTIAAAVVILLLGVAMFLTPPELEADKSELRFLPDQPQAGQKITVEYRPSSLLAGEDRLVLRARYRTPEDEAYNRGMKHVTVDQLERGDDGIYRGAFRLPDSVVYAVFAVENSAGVRIDSNGQKLWDLLVRSPEGVPLFDALKQKSNDLHGRNWEIAFQTAQRRAELYPDRVESWSELYFFQRAVLGEAGADSLREFHRARFRQFERKLAREPHLSGDQLGSMLWYSYSIGDSVVTDRWRERFLRETPNHPLAVQERAVDLARRYRSDPAELLAIMERMWEEIGPVHEWQGRNGFSAAQKMGDPDMIIRWADRYLLFWPHDQAWVATEIAEVPALRGEALRRLRAELRRLDSVGDDRLLVRTIEEQRAANEKIQSWALAATGQILIDAGRTQAGLDTLELATRTGWNTELFSTIADAKLSVGDTAGAVELWAKVAVDPSTNISFADTVRTRIGAGFDTERWQARTDRAREEMRARVLADATTKSVRGSVRLVGLDGGSLDLKEQVTGRPTVVVFWSRFCGPALDQLAGIQSLSERLSARGVQTVMIVDEKPSEELRSFLTGENVTLPVYSDVRGEAGRAFDQWGTPSYFVLDDSGRIRFEYSSLEEIPRQVAALETPVRNEVETLAN